MCHQGSSTIAIWVLFFLAVLFQSCQKDLEPFSAPEGVLPGLFSVSETNKIVFSRGNLQYSPVGSHACVDGTKKPGTWRLAEHQYDIIGEDNSNIGSTQLGWIDLFCWGSSGYPGPGKKNNTKADTGGVIHEGTSGYQDDGRSINPISTSFYCPKGNLTGVNRYYDWGVYNAISNGGGFAVPWRVLTFDEWNYLYEGRQNAVAKYGLAMVNGVAGVVLLPDRWTLPSKCSFECGFRDGYNTNIYSADEWMFMENAGAVFMPAAGFRDGETVKSVGIVASWWTASANWTDANAGCFCFSNGGYEDEIKNLHRSTGLSVRLVRDWNILYDESSQ